MHDQCWKTAESLSAQLLDAKRQLAEVNKRLDGFKPRDIVAVLAEAKADARKQAFEDAIRVTETERERQLYNAIKYEYHAIKYEDRNLKDMANSAEARAQGAFMVIEALRRERDKTPK